MKMLVSLIAWLTLVNLLAADEVGKKPQPNIVIVITDDQGYGDLSCHGNPVLKTPNLDKLHARSVRLTDFHVAPMCTPTRSQLMTGVHCLRNGAMNVSSGRTMLRRQFPTLADIFATLGYWTGQFGKWHLGDNYPYRPIDRGFRESIFFPSSHIGSAPDFWNNDYFDDTYSHNGVREKYKGYCTDIFFAEAIRWMKTCAARKQPFLAYIATNAPHGPFFVPAQYREMYEGQKEKNLARFFGMIANIDDNIGRLDNFLVDSGLQDNTILVFLTDNGGTVGTQLFNAGMRGKKIDLYEGGHRVPCFIRWPAGGLRHAADIGELTQVQDLLPTLVELAGHQLPKNVTVDGTSLATLLRGDTETLADRKLVVQFSRMLEPAPKKGDACVLWQRWRLIQDKELHNLADDPQQQTNLIDRHPEVADKLRKHYAAWWAEVSPRVNEHQAIIVGSKKENPLQLSPADWEDAFLDQGAQIRAGLRRGGAWNVEVAQAGRYEITLRRWPEDADTPIQAGIPPTKHTDGVFPAGVALPIAKASLKVADAEVSRVVANEDKGIVFTVELPAGRTKLHASFIDESSKDICGAYYVTVRRLR